MSDQVSWRVGLLALGVTGAAAGSASAAQVAYYAFDSFNEVSSTSEATAASNAFIDTTRKVFGTGSARFDGLDDYARVADANVTPAFNFGTGSFSVSGWVYLDSLNQNKNLFLKSTNTGADQGIGIRLENGTIRFSMAGGFSATSTEAAAGIAAQEWFHIAAVRDSSDFSGGNGTLRLYVDGIQVGVSTGGNNNQDLTSTRDLIFGGRELGGNNTVPNFTFAGNLDEFRFFNHALGAAEVADLAVVPEPASLALLAIGLAFIRRR